MFTRILPLLVLALSFSGRTFAAEEKKKTAEGETTIKIEDAADKKNKVAGDVDEELTNAKLRAESGSKSKFSGSFTANYYGGSLATPMDKDRPNTNQEPTPPRVRLKGEFGGRYRATKNVSYFLGAGYDLQRPFHTNETQYGNVSNPYVQANYAGKVGPVQSISSLALIASTDKDELIVGQQVQLDATETLMYDFGGSKFSVGMALEGIYTKFQDGTKNQIARSRMDNGDYRTFIAGTEQVDGNIGIYPLMEYAMNDRVSFRTVFRPMIYDHIVLKNENGGGWHKRRWTQSIGVGVALTRDVYLYPNFQYDWYHWQGEDFNWFAKKTRENSTIGLAATVNIF